MDTIENRREEKRVGYLHKQSWSSRGVLRILAWIEPLLSVLQDLPLC